MVASESETEGEESPEEVEELPPAAAVPFNMPSGVYNHWLCRTTRHVRCSATNCTHGGRIETMQFRLKLNREGALSWSQASTWSFL